MKIKVEFTIPTGQFANAKPQVEIEIPDDLNPREQYFYLHDLFYNLTQKRETPVKKPLSQSAQYMRAQQTGADVDHIPGQDDGVEPKEYRGPATREHYKSEE